MESPQENEESYPHLPSPSPSKMTSKMTIIKKIDGRPALWRVWVKGFLHSRVADTAEHEAIFTVHGIFHARVLE